MGLAVTPSESVAFNVLFKRYFFAIVLLMIAAAAYLQAAGAAQLIGAAITVPPAPPRPLSAANREQPLRARAGKRADPILDRNVFDSVTGPLKEQPKETTSPEKKRKLDLSDPLGAAQCGDIQAHIITESDDPNWSFAALQGPGEKVPSLRRVGDEVDHQQIAYIGYNSRLASPAVWLVTDSELCQTLLFPREEAEKSKADSAKDEDEPTPAPARRKRGAPTVPPDIASKIRKVSDTEFHVDRAVVDKILQDQAELMRSARIVPEKKDGQVVGIRMFGVRPNTLLGTLGFQNGDRLETINGFNMSSPEKALEAYARLRTASSLEVTINRRGKPMNIDYQIK